MWRAGFGRGFGPVVRQTAEWRNETTWTKSNKSKEASNWMTLRTGKDTIIWRRKL